jgi:16S rRNA processing protein RimM
VSSDATPAMTSPSFYLMESASQWIVLAHILRPQGRRGEVLADLFTDFPQRFGQHPQVWIAAQGFAEQAATGSIAGPPSESAEVASHWLPVGKNAGRIVLHFTGVDSIEQAQQFAGKDVLVPLAERMPLSPGAAYISDLIGCTVYDRGRALGVVDSVQFPTTPDGLRRLEDAAPLLAVASPEGGEILIPFANEFLLDLDAAAKSIRMALPEGLAEINQPGHPPAAKE